MLTRRGTLIGLLGTAGVAQAYPSLFNIIGRGLAPETPPNLPAALTVTNTSAGTLGSQTITVGQVFKRGNIPKTTQFSAGGNQVQMDSLSTWPDGTVKMAALTFVVPSLAAAGSQSFTLSPTAVGSYTPITSTTFLNAITGLTVGLTFTTPSYSTTVDVKAALTTAFAGTPDLWLNGPQALQCRVDIPVTITGAAAQSFHLVCDVTVYADGNVKAEIQFCNDLGVINAINVKPNASILPALVYTASITLNGTTTNIPLSSITGPAGTASGTLTSITQYQYQRWRQVVSTYSAATFGVWNCLYNVTADSAYLISTGAVMPYDLTPANAPTPLLTGYNTMQTVTNFGQPFVWNTKQNNQGDSQNGVYAILGDVGDRPELGPLTEQNTAWLMTQDIRAAAQALVQADTAGSLCVNLNTNTPSGGVLPTAPSWPSVVALPKVWLDPGNRGGSGGTQTFAYPFPGSTTQNLPYNNSGWSLSDSPAHWPSLSYYPYLRTACRWYLDNLNAGTAYLMGFNNLTVRLYNNALAYQGAGYYPDIILLSGAGGLQTRTSAWVLRDIVHAWFIGKDGDASQSFATQVLSDNMTWANYQVNNWLTNCGQAAGFWIPELDSSGLYYGAWTNPSNPAAPVQSALSSSLTGGTLAAKKYYYVVTALNANGESIGSNELNITTSGATSSVTVSWGAVSGATGYKVYRGTASNGENTYYSVGNVTSYVDTGSAGTSGSVITIGSNNSSLGVSLWQQDFLSGSFLLAALMGHSGAQSVAAFQKNWLAGRWTNLSHDSCTYKLMLIQGPGVATYNTLTTFAAKPTYQQTWANIETLQQQSFDHTSSYPALSNGAGWAQSQGYYGNVYRHTLGALGSLYPNDSSVSSSQSGITSSGAPGVNNTSIDGSSWVNKGCKWNIVPTTGVG